MRLFAARPRRFGNHAGRLLDRKPFTGSPGVLLITTQGRPTHLTCGQTISRIIVPPPGVLAKRLSVPLSGQEYSLETAYTVCPGVLSVSLVWAGTYPHGWYSIFKFPKTAFLVRSSYSPWERLFLVALKKFFYFLFESLDPIIVSTGCYAKPLAYFLCGIILNFQKGNL